MHQYVTSLLDELDDNQKLAHPEVKDCFNKFDKVGTIKRRQPWFMT